MIKDTGGDVATVQTAAELIQEGRVKEKVIRDPVRRGLVHGREHLAQHFSVTCSRISLPEPNGMLE